MATRIFVNLPVKDLNRSIVFFTKLGFTFNPQFTDDKATCMIVSDTIFVMLLVHERFKDFTRKAISDATQTTEVLLCLDTDSQEKVNAIIAKAVEAGGTLYAEPMDYGWMYSHSFSDLDGHQWEIIYMDPEGMPQ